MYPEWPSTLPRNVLRDSFSYNPQSGLIRTNMDAGYAKVRKRFTAVTSEMNVSFSMTFDQLETFETFFKSAAGLWYGARKMYFPNPLWASGPGESEQDRPDIVVRMKIDGVPYMVVPDGQTTDFVVTFVIERMPEDA